MFEVIADQNRPIARFSVQNGKPEIFSKIRESPRVLRDLAFSLTLATLLLNLIVLNLIVLVCCSTEYTLVSLIFMHQNFVQLQKKSIGNVHSGIFDVQDIR